MTVPVISRLELAIPHIAMALLGITLVSGCAFDELADGLPDDSECTTCHGSEDNPAPPTSVGGIIDSSALEVGAHQSHVRGGDLRLALECDSCHINPVDTTDDGHIDPSPAEVVFGDLASKEGLQPVWDRETGTCSEVYCHGASLSSGTNTTPEWTLVDGTQAACGSCHGTPPDWPHPQDEDCQVCHDKTVMPSGDIDVEGGYHINGTRDLPDDGCSSCHGTTDRDPDHPDNDAAPPLSLTGSSDTLETGVGAHLTHLTDGDFRSAVACDECHIRPDDVDDPGHIDTIDEEGPRAEVIFGSLARTDDSEASWDRIQETCSNVYCHGATLSGGSNLSPQWTRVDGTQAACGSCHGSPPDWPHPQNEDCHACHDKTVTPSGEIDVAGGYHINGVANAPDDGCTGCHGTTDRDPDHPDNDAAPPLSLTGSSDTVEIGVGAHLTHLTDGDFRLAVACSECHIRPDDVDDPEHIDNIEEEGPRAEVTFGSLAKMDAAEASWDRSQETCSNVYCHGAGLSGGSNLSPQWTRVDGTQAVCGSCHGTPPDWPHPQNMDCLACHDKTMASSGGIDVEGGYHINGVRDVADEGCTGCHGTLNRDPVHPDNDAAPPLSLTGSSDDQSIGVGAHLAHLTDGDLRQAVACEECHIRPEQVDDPEHVDNIEEEGPRAEVTFGSVARTDDVDASWDRSAETCSNVYCHGPTLDGGTNKSPRWTLVDGTQAACGTCHGNPPSLPHPLRDDCQSCHPDTVSAPGVIKVESGAHINGKFEGPDVDDPETGCSACHGTPERAETTVIEGVNNDAAPPGSLSEASGTSSIRIGAHQAHLTDGSIRAALACSTCHDVPQKNEDSGHYVNSIEADGYHAEVNFQGLAVAAGEPSPGWDRGTGTCSNVYCHGASLADGNTKEPQWTLVDGTQVVCDSCHGNPPKETHGESTDDVCSSCHSRTLLSGVDENGSPLINIADGYHINGETDFRLPRPIP